MRWIRFLWEIVGPGLGIAAACFSPVWAGGPQPPGQDDSGQHLSIARVLLRAGDVPSAIREAGLARVEGAADPHLEVLLGEICYRDADFDGAASHFLSALRSAPDSARAHFGLARVEQIRSRRNSARRHLREAHRLNPKDPEVIRAYAAAARDPQQEIALLREYLALRSGEPREQVEMAMARIQVLSKIDSRKIAALETPYGQYHLKLSPWVPSPGHASGALLRVRLNGEKTFSLVLDTGAQGIYVTAAAARKLRLTPLVDSGIDGVGSGPPHYGRLALADSLEIDELRLRNCVINLTDKPLTEYADGVIGANVFERFVLRVDLRHNVLDLLPYREGLPDSIIASAPWSDWDASTKRPSDDLLPIAWVGHMAMIKARVEKKDAVYFVVDTGASYSAVDSKIAAAVFPGRIGPSLSLAAAGAAVPGVRSIGTLALQLGSRELIDRQAASVDLSALSNRHGVRISGLIGYPLLSRSVVTINYRDGLMGLEQ